MGNIEEANRLLGKALGELTEWRKAWVLDKTHIDASEKYILSVLALLDNMEEENVENYEIAYRQGWQAAKASSLKEPPAKEPKNVKSYSEALADLHQLYRPPPDEPEKSTANLSDAMIGFATPPEELKECCQKEKERDQFSATCPECKTRLPRPDGIKCWLDEDQRDRPCPPGAPAIGDRYIPYATEDLEKVVK